MGLADEGVRALHRRDTTLVRPSKPVQILPLWEQWDYPTAIRPYAEEYIRRVQARERDLAFLMFGVHL